MTLLNMKDEIEPIQSDNEPAVGQIELNTGKLRKLRKVLDEGNLWRPSLISYQFSFLFIMVALLEGQQQSQVEH